MGRVLPLSVSNEISLLAKTRTQPVSTTRCCTTELCEMQVGCQDTFDLVRLEADVGERMIERAAAI